jgi:hypothetical protein
MIGDNALAAFHFHVNDVEAVKRNDGLLGLLGALGLGATVRQGWVWMVVRRRFRRAAVRGLEVRRRS